MKQRSLFSKPKTDPPKSKPVQRKAVITSEENKSVGLNPRFTQPFAEKRKLKSPEEIEIYDLIQRHRIRLLIWSKLYYDMDTTVVSDKVFDEVGRELVKLQEKYPDISKIVAYAEEFQDWDATTGFHLPLNDPWVCRKAQELLLLDRRYGHGKNR